MRWGSRLLVLGVLASLVPVLVLRWIDPPASAFMIRQAIASARLGQRPPADRYQWVDWGQIPASLKRAAIASEDQRFFTHLGLDPIEIRAALRRYWQGGRLRGASTISQQTAKNLFLWPGSGWGRKLLEGWLALLIELVWPKERILEVYLNIAQFGPATYGVEAASRRYFNCLAAALTAEQAALLIGVLPAPGHHQPDRPSESLQRRAWWILKQSRRLGGFSELPALKTVRKQARCALPAPNAERIRL
ncbi:monofunctional biosynthetic peptidoglycan transglycosylase [Caldichromatium japonicum]|uniref:Biosynthetic peptidoglycan transglycosylase n=1 Tax=Caldichromatium japonicum TaxID=2699430 RepID=A0A6G7VEV7_9GAMM|nr:monofunctional biosynthetic peptidoglycan transglycosylase [Caldichromatium japonicum]QIK38327.1 monofunctional biosynthetic peptidoglycan transglycosylase [Caldichromatium japonicum]